MGECSDFHVGETVIVHLLAQGRGGSIDVALEAPVVFVWEHAIDVRVADGVFRFERGVFDCAALEGGGHCRVQGGDFEEYIPADEYAPDEEIDTDG